MSYPETYGGVRLWKTALQNSFCNYHNGTALRPPSCYGVYSPWLTTVRHRMTVARMKKKPSDGRAEDRIRKTLSLPKDLTARIQAEADDKYAGDFTRATLELLATKYPEARKFLRDNTTFKHSKKK